MLAVLSATAPTALAEPPSATAAAVPGLIVDTDIGGGGCRDVDDVGALGVANALADSGVVNLLGVVQNTQATNSTGVISVVQRYYSRTIPTGVYRGSGLRDLAALPYVADLVARWPSPVRNSSQAGSAVKLYRHLLAGQPDRSVAVASIGLLTNLAALFQSSADEHSELFLRRGKLRWSGSSSAPPLPQVRSAASRSSGRRSFGSPSWAGATRPAKGSAASATSAPPRGVPRELPLARSPNCGSCPRPLSGALSPTSGGIDHRAAVQASAHVVERLPASVDVVFSGLEVRRSTASSTPSLLFCDCSHRPSRWG